MDSRTIYASQHAVLDSHVYEGGGTDDTQALQAILDRAPTLGRLHLVLDGAARISKGLTVYSNTTIECPDKSCGLFLSDGANCSLVSNAHRDMNVIGDRNITLIGGVYNNNSPGQVHHVEAEGQGHVCEKWVFGMEFYGVENVLMRDVTLANQRTFALLMANWKHVTMENIHIDRRERADYQNQDGLHFWGPGRFLTLRNIRGNSGDDFIALAPDENDRVSSIEDVLIDGVQLDDADQGIRLLTCGEGRLDRVVIRNVTGTYRSYGFIVNPWFDGPGGRFGNIVFDTVDLRPMKNNYDYSPPFLFKLGGRVESVTVKNLYHHLPEHAHTLFVIGGGYIVDVPESKTMPTRIDRLIIDGLYVDERDATAVQDAYIRVKSHVGVMQVKDVMFRREGAGRGGTLIRVEAGHIEDLRLVHIRADCLDALTSVSPPSQGHRI